MFNEIRTIWPYLAQNLSPEKKSYTAQLRSVSYAVNGPPVKIY